MRVVLLAAALFSFVLAIVFGDTPPTKAAVSPPNISGADASSLSGTGQAISVSNDSIFLNVPSHVGVNWLSTSGVFNDHVNRLGGGSYFGCLDNAKIGVEQLNVSPQELVFTLKTPDSFAGQDPADLGQTYKTGPLTRNVDRMIHAKLRQDGPFRVVVSWEDLRWKGALPAPTPDSPSGAYAWDDCVMEVTASPAAYQLPWPVNEEWAMTSPPDHALPGQGAMDFAAFQAAADPISCTSSQAKPTVDTVHWIRPIANGMVTKLIPNEVIEITHDDGHTSGYYHIANIQVGLHDRVNIFTNLGHPSSCGGIATAAHIHFYLLDVTTRGRTFGGWIVGTGSDNCLHLGSSPVCGGSRVKNYGVLDTGSLTATRVLDQTYRMQTGDRVKSSLQVNLLNGVTHFLHFFLGPFFSDVDLNITRPDGSAVSPSDADVRYDKTTNSVEIQLDDAPGGEWQYEIVANELEPGGEDIALTVDDDSFAVKVPDTTPPMTSIALDPTAPNGARGWYTSDVSATLSAVDPDPGDGSTASGVASTFYQVNGGGWQVYDVAHPFVVSTESLDNKVEYYSVDNADNIESTHEFHFHLDKTKPDVNITAGGLDGLSWDQAHLQHGVLTNTGTLALTGNATDNLCLWEVRTVDVDSGLTTSSQQPLNPNVFPPPPPNSLSYALNVPLHTGINTIDVTAEDCAGWTKALRIQVVYVVPGPFAPEGKGFWYNAVKTRKYTPAQFQTLLDYTNVASDVWGSDTARNRYGLLTLAHARDLLNYSATNPDMEYKMEAHLLADWLDLVSGRLAVKRPVNVSKVGGWPIVMDDIGGNPLTFAYKVMLEIEEKAQPAKAPFAINSVAKDLAEALNSGTIILR